jgi:hypothetical protein
MVGDCVAIAAGDGLSRDWMLIANPALYQTCLLSHAKDAMPELETKGTGAGPRKPGETTSGLEQKDKLPTKLNMKLIECGNRGELVLGLGAKAMQG